jgi:CheY-like chemotaxis protein
LLKTPNLSGDEQQLYISVIEKSGERMLNIINDIISISKIESGLMEVRIQESNMNEQIEYVYKFFKPEIEAKGIQFSFKELLSVKEATINTDREKVYAVLTNLVKNAIKFTEKGTIEFGYHIKGNFLEFYVKDSGIGVPKDRQEAIFERFIQADIDDKMARQGAGLGLSISKAYVEMLGGKLWVEGEEGKGSLFYFTLPCDAETKGENERIIDNTDTIVESPLKKLKILIVDDDETSSWLLGQMLKKLDREVLYAENGLKAVEICGNNPDIDLILMDIKMDIMDGYEATRQIRQFNNKSFIIAQTAFALAGDRERAIEAGCNEYISKPITQNKLLSMIKGHFAA